MQKQTLKLKEWESIIIPYDNLSTQEMITLQNRGIITTSMQQEGLKISANAYVGFETNTTFSLEVKPKISNLTFLKMVAFVHGFIPINEQSVAQLGAGEHELLDLLIYQWLVLVEPLTTRMRRKYIRKKENSNYIKGKIDIHALSKQGVITAKNPIEYQVLEMNQPLNQIVKAGLIFFKTQTMNPIIQNKCNRLLRNFLSIRTISLNTKELEIEISRLNRLEIDYKEPLTYLKWILNLSGMGPNKEIGQSFWINMNILFQKYLTKVFQVYAPEYTFKSEVSDRTVFNYLADANPAKRKAISIRPDLQVFTGNELIKIIDFKYKDYRENPVSTVDLYQLSNYGLSIGKGNVDPIILYPTAEYFPDQIIQVNLPVTEQKQKIILRSVDVVKLIEMIERGIFRNSAVLVKNILK